MGLPHQQFSGSRVFPGFLTPVLAQFFAVKSYDKSNLTKVVIVLG